MVILQGQVLNMLCMTNNETHNRFPTCSSNIKLSKIEFQNWMHVLESLIWFLLTIKFHKRTGWVKCDSLYNVFSDIDENMRDVATHTWDVGTELPIPGTPCVCRVGHRRSVQTAQSLSHQTSFVQFWQLAYQTPVNTMF